MNPTNKKRKSLPKYFAPFPTWALFSLLIGTLLICTSQLFGLIPAILGAGVLYWWYDKPSDVDYDILKKSDLNDLNEKALRATNLDKSELVREPVVIISPRFWKVSKAFVGNKKGKDDLFRYTPLGVTVIFFTEHELSVYTCAHDLTTGNSLNESAQFFFYRQVDGAKTETQSITFKLSDVNKKVLKRFPELKEHLKNDIIQLNSAEKFVLYVSGKSVVEVLLYDPNVIHNDATSEEKLSKQAVKAVLKMLRVKNG